MFLVGSRSHIERFRAILYSKSGSYEDIMAAVNTSLTVDDCETLKKCAVGALSVAKVQGLGQSEKNLRLYLDKAAAAGGPIDPDTNALIKFFTYGTGVTVYAAAVLYRCSKGIWPTDYLYFAAHYSDLTSTANSFRDSGERFAAQLHDFSDFN